MATANGLTSMPLTASSARCTRTRRFSPGACTSHSANNRVKAPSRKWPDPQVGSMSVTPSIPNSSIAGLRVRSRMNSSMKSGVCNSAYVLRADSNKSWYRSPKNRVSQLRSLKSCMIAPDSGSILHQNSTSCRAPSAVGASSHSGLWVPRISPSPGRCRYRSKTASSHSRSLSAVCVRRWSWRWSCAMVRRSPTPESSGSSTRPLSSQNRTKTQASTHATAACVIQPSRQLSYDCAVRPALSARIHCARPTASISRTSVQRLRRSSSRSPTSFCKSVSSRKRDITMHFRLCWIGRHGEHWPASRVRWEPTGSNRELRWLRR